MRNQSRIEGKKDPKAGWKFPLFKEKHIPMFGLQGMLGRTGGNNQTLLPEQVKLGILKKNSWHSGFCLLSLDPGAS